MKYFFALLIFIAAWFVGTAAVWFASALIRPLARDEAIFIGVPHDVRNIVSNILAAVLGLSLAIAYFRRAKRRGS
jgi:uncharacterized membrane protein SpoIIM required for sporulation